MCGFAGLLKWNGLAPDDAARVRGAADVLAHRGPDSSGFWSDSHIALGFRRLKVIDLSPAGEQPMTNEDGSLVIVFNGEIYNFRELREELRANHTFKSQSDTEVLLHGWEQWGEELLPKLRGMFAFALWEVGRPAGSPGNPADRPTRLVLARDPVGVKPLYFAERDGLLAFASEPKALFALGIKPEIDPVAIHEALTYRYVPAPRSGFKDVEKLPPGNVATVEKGEVRYRKWWVLTPSPVATEVLTKYRFIKLAWQYNTAPSSERGPRVRAKGFIEGSVEGQIRPPIWHRLIADVPLGLWLSGGIDSGLVLSKMREGVHTFSAGFANPEYDERDLALKTGNWLFRSFHATHSDFEVPADVFRLLPQVVWHADEPFFDSSCLPTFVLAEKTKPHATVVLSGDGGDEAFAGYDRYVGMKLLERYKKTPALFRRLALRYAKWKYPAATRQGWDRMIRWLEKCRLMEESGHHPYLAAMELFSEEQKAALYGEAMSEAVEGCDAREYLENALLRAREPLTPNPSPARGEGDRAASAARGVGVLQRADLETYLPGDVLHKVDRMSMAHGLEVRSPFLDVDLISFALSLPDDVRLPGRQTKPLLRHAAAQTLPPEVVNARKRGFGVPLDDWFRGPLKEIALLIFKDSALVKDKLFKPRFWENLWDEHQAQKAQHGERLYALLSLELWYRMFIVGPAPMKRPDAMQKAKGNIQK